MVALVGLSQGAPQQVRETRHADRVGSVQGGATVESHSHHAMALMWKVLLLKGDGERERGEERREEGGFFFLKRHFT